MRYNRQQLTMDIKKDTEHLRALKTKRHEVGSAWSWRDHLDLKDAKRRATLHHACAAAIRGKIHLTKWTSPEGERRPMTKDEQMKLIEKVWPQYALAEQAA